MPPTVRMSFGLFDKATGNPDVLNVDFDVFPHTILSTLVFYPKSIGESRV
jgi:hypothetical protein